jgi:hypothetical protein
MSAHRRDVRPRYGRIAALVTSASVTVVAALASVGLLGPSTVQADLARTASYSEGTPTADPSLDTSLDPSSSASIGVSDSGTADLGELPDPEGSSAPEDTQRSSAASATTLPADSGTGRRIVFSQRLQRVWLVSAHDSTQRTYLVSGSLTDNLLPGTYSVYSKSEHAVGVDDSGTMEYFVRFTHGTEGAAIGFHDIPIDDGRLVQTAAQLGTPQSHGCIRQLRSDAIKLWDFAPVGTEVDVVA